MPSTLLSLFSQVSDPRRGQGKMYELPPILLFTVLAMLAGAVSYRQVQAFIHSHLDRLNAVFGMSLREAPAYTKLRFILRGLDGAELERAFRKHAAELPTAMAGDAAAPVCVAIDGKTLRGSFDAMHAQKTFAAALATGNHLLVQLKSNQA